MTRLQLESLRQERKRMMAAIKDAKNGEMSRVASLRAEIEEEKREIVSSPSLNLFLIFREHSLTEVLMPPTE